MALESILFNCRDYLRGSAAPNDKRDIILFVFLRFIGEKFEGCSGRNAANVPDRGLSEEKLPLFLIRHHDTRISSTFPRPRGGRR